MIINHTITPYCTLLQVRDETRHRTDDLAPGGFIFAPIHVIQDGMPPPDIMARWEAL